MQTSLESATDNSMGKRDKYRILYAIQNVGGIDFSKDIGDTVPVKYTLSGLQQAGHLVNCVKLQGKAVSMYEDVINFQDPIDARLGVTNSMIFRGFEGGIRRLQRELGLPYFAFFDSLRFQEACSGLLNHYNLCHEHNGLFCLGATWACRNKRIPYVLTFSADPIMELELVGRPLKGVHAWVANKATKFSFDYAQKIICVSEPAKKHLVDVWQVNSEKIVIMPNGVDIASFGIKHSPTDVRTEYQLDGKMIVSFVGSFQMWHGIDLLVESFAKVLHQLPNSKLLLVGDGPARTSIEEIVNNLGLASSVKITGLVPQKKIPEILSAVDVAVIPYPKLPNELWFSPLKLYEYMAAGKAIVASSSGQIADVIQDGENGRLVKPGDINDLANVIISLLINPDEREWIGQNARKQAVEQHSWDRYISHLEEIYHSVLTEPFHVNTNNGAIG
ncbi:glycosyltransferase family 4 protein [Chloroflexota bacterium]